MVFSSCAEKNNQNNESDYATFVDDFFVLTYPKKLPDNRVEKIISYLHYAREKNRQILNTQLSKKVKINFYPSTQIFCNETSVEWWKAGVSKSNIIHLQPVNVLLERNILKSTLIHEYTYFVIKEICTTQAPLWFIEGIASYIANEERLYRNRQVIENIKNGNQFGISTLNQYIKSSDRLQSQQAYWQANSLVNYMVKIKGKNVLYQLLVSLHKTHNFPMTFHKIVGISLKEFEKQWFKSL